jgi:transposase
MRTKSENIIEYQRTLCVKLKDEEFTQTQIANILGKTQGWVSQVLTKFKQLGEEGLKEKKAKGSTSKITVFQKDKLRILLNDGALKYGFEGDIWTRKRIKLVIEEQFGIQYSERHVDRILRKMGYSIQRPQKKDYRQKQELIEEWATEKIPEIKKKPKKKKE